MTDLATAIERYDRAAREDDPEELDEAERILRGRLFRHAIPVVAHGWRCYAATTKGIGVTRLRRAG